MSKNKHKFLTFAALMTGATVAVHFINHTIAAAAQLKQMLHISNDNYFEWRFGNIYYTKKGTGSPILLIHDTLPGASGYEWNKIEEEQFRQGLISAEEWLDKDRLTIAERKEKRQQAQQKEGACE